MIVVQADALVDCCTSKGVTTPPLPLDREEKIDVLKKCSLDKLPSSVRGYRESKLDKKIDELYKTLINFDYPNILDDINIENTQKQSLKQLLKSGINLNIKTQYSYKILITMRKNSLNYLLKLFNNHSVSVEFTQQEPTQKRKTEKITRYFLHLLALEREIESEQKFIADNQCFFAYYMPFNPLHKGQLKELSSIAQAEATKCCLGILDKRGILRPQEQKPTSTLCKDLIDNVDQSFRKWFFFIAITAVCTYTLLLYLLLREEDSDLIKRSEKLLTKRNYSEFKKTLPTLYKRPYYLGQLFSQLLINEKKNEDQKLDEIKFLKKTSKILLDKIKNSLGYTLLHVAANMNLIKIVQYLIETYPEFLNETNQLPLQSVIYLACTDGDAKMVKILLEKDALRTEPPMYPTTMEALCDLEPTDPKIELIFQCLEDIDQIKFWEIVEPKRLESRKPTQFSFKLGLQYKQEVTAHPNPWLLTAIQSKDKSMYPKLLKLYISKTVPLPHYAISFNAKYKLMRDYKTMVSSQGIKMTHKGQREKLEEEKSEKRKL